MYQTDSKKLEEFKAKYKGVYLITVDDKAALFRKPTRQHISFATAASSQGMDAIAFTESIMKNTFLEGDREILEDDDYFLPAMPVINQMVESKQAEIKKL